MAPTMSRPIITLTCLLVFMRYLCSSDSSRGWRRLIARLKWNGPPRVRHASRELILPAGLDNQAPVVLHFDRENVHGPGGRTGDNDAALSGIGGTVAGAAEPALAPRELEVWPPGDRTAEVGALRPEGEHAAGRLLAVRCGPRPRVHEPELALKDTDGVAAGRRNTLRCDGDRAPEAAKFAQPHEVQWHAEHPDGKQRERAEEAPQDENAPRDRLPFRGGGGNRRGDRERVRRGSGDGRGGCGRGSRAFSFQC